MERPKDSSKGKYVRETSRDRERNRRRRSPSRANPRDREPRTTVVTTSRGRDDDYEYDDPPQRPPGSREKGQPYVEYRGAKESAQPYSALQPAGGIEAGESSSAYHKSYDTLRPSIRYYSDEKRRDLEEVRNPAPRDEASLTETFGGLRIRDDGSNYALSSQRQSEFSSSEARYPDSAQTQFGPSTTPYSSRDLDPRLAATATEDPYCGQAHTSSGYHPTQAYEPTSTTAPYLQTLESAQPGPASSQYYPTAQTYQYSQQNTTPLDARKQNNPPSRGNRSAQQKLDASFFVRKNDYKKFFRVGKVFMTLWSEQFGSSAEQGSFVSDVIYGEKVYSKVRRFIVVREAADKRSASCLPITSYGGSGFDKTGIELSGHGFIYSRVEPKPVPRMCSKALRVQLSPKGPDLAHPSLVNYGKVHNVEANWKVKDIGDLDSDSRKALLRYFRRVFCLEDDTDLPEPEMAPRAKDAVLAHVGAGVGNYAAIPIGETNPASTTAQEHFMSIPATEGYPPANYGPASEERGSTASQYPASIHSSAYPAQYESSSLHKANPGAPSYERYTVSYATANAVSTPSYHTPGPSGNQYHDQYAFSNSQGSARNTYPAYDNLQAQQSWAPAAPNSNSGYNEGYQYASATAYQNPNRQHENFAEGVPRGTYTRPSEYDESAIAETGLEEDIRMPSVAEAEKVLRERKRRDSKAGEGSSSHRKRRDDRRP